MIKVGIMGEDPNDTRSIINLIAPLFKERAQFITLVRNIRGSQLDTEKTARMLGAEVKTEQPAILVVVRDSDCIRSDEASLEARRAKFRALTKDIAIPKLLLLNIYELEALILADIAAFNRLYNVALKSGGDVSMKAHPKEYLKEKTFGQRKTFHESDCPTVFAHLDYATVQKNCRYFREFISSFNQEVSRIDEWS